MSLMSFVLGLICLILGRVSYQLVKILVTVKEEVITADVIV
jgi:hypothetical protein